MLFYDIGNNFPFDRIPDVNGIYFFGFRGNLDFSLRNNSQDLQTTNHEIQLIDDRNRPFNVLYIGRAIGNDTLRRRLRRHISNGKIRNSTLRFSILMILLNQMNNGILNINLNLNNFETVVSNFMGNLYVGWIFPTNNNFITGLNNELVDSNIQINNNNIQINNNVLANIEMQLIRIFNPPFNIMGNQRNQGNNNNYVTRLIELRRNFGR